MTEPRKATESDWNLTPITQWLLQEGRLLPVIEDMTRQLGQRLYEAGAPLWRFRISMRTLHPLVAASTSIWEKDEDILNTINSTHGIEQRSEFLGSPYQIIIETRSHFRKRLEGSLTDGDHLVLHELKTRGGTDYFGLPMDFTEDNLGILIFSSDTPNGFTDKDIAKFTGLASVLAPIAEAYSSKNVSKAIAEAYLGPRTGQRMLSGQITRGDIEQITAAILFSDIRDWTGLNTRFSNQEALALANRYFDIIADAVDQNGGEILKFIGDSVLAIFPLEESSSSATTVCSNALAAARQSVAMAENSNPPLQLDFGIGMHYGDVLYGNIGSKSRLDFTVMGQAVNTTARIESLCSKLDTPILFSEDFASQLDEQSVQVAEEMLKGYDSTFRVMSIQ